jgi:uncharacterized protein (UPF0333 family)
MNKKGQAAMEFLMTYGWAIVVVLAAIGALAYFGVLSPQKLLPDRTSFAAPVPNVDNAVINLNANTVAIAFRNNKGIAIQIPSSGTFTVAATYCTVGSAALTGVTSSTAPYSAIPFNTSIQNGDGFVMTWSCTHAAGAAIGSKFHADISFDYINTDTGQTIKQTGSVDGKWS